MKLNRQIDRSSFDPSVLKSIPMASHWIGSWLRDCQLNNIGFQPVSLGSCAGQASMAFWAQKPIEEFGRSQIEYSAPHKEGVP